MFEKSSVSGVEILQNETRRQSEEIVHMQTYLPASMVLEGREYSGPAGEKLTELYDSFTLAGKGAFSQVFQARRVDSGLICAVKVVTTEARSMKNIIREAAMLQSRMIKHPYIVDTLTPAVFVADDGYGVCIIHEYMGGMNLQDVICMGEPLNEEDLQVVFHRLVMAMKHLHSVGVLHGDIKPDNVMLKEEGQDGGGGLQTAKVSDFGLARILGTDGRVHCRELAGTNGFLAPELASQHYDKSRASFEYTAAVDVYAAGVTLYTMLGGDWKAPMAHLENPSKGVLFNERVWEQARAWRKRHGRKPIGKGVQHLVIALLHPDPACRPTAEDVAGHPWVRGGSDADLSADGGRHISKAERFISMIKTRIFERPRRASIKATGGGEVVGDEADEVVGRKGSTLQVDPPGKNFRYTLKSKFDQIVQRRSGDGAPARWGRRSGSDGGQTGVRSSFDLTPRFWSASGMRRSSGGQGASSSTPARGDNGGRGSSEDSARHDVEAGWSEGRMPSLSAGRRSEGDMSLPVPGGSGRGVDSCSRRSSDDGSATFEMPWLATGDAEDLAEAQAEYQLEMNDLTRRVMAAKKDAKSRALRKRMPRHSC